MRERIPHDLLIGLGLAGIVVGIVMPLDSQAGKIGLGIWIMVLAVLMVKYR